MAKKETIHKPRTNKYETKVAVKGTFEDMIKASVKNIDKIKDKKKNI
jgi:hypothetical protein